MVKNANPDQWILASNGRLSLILGVDVDGLGYEAGADE